MFEVEFLVPIVDVPEESYERFQKYLCKKFGGYSKKSGIVSGGWLDDDGNLHKDSSKIYAVAVDGFGDSDKIHPAVKFIKQEFDQEAVYIRYLDQVEILT